MSLVSSVVVVAPVGWSNERIERLGKALYASQRREHPLFDPDYGYAPIPMKIDGRYVPDGGKAPGGTIWWLGLNYMDLYAMLDELGRVEEFHGVWVWVEHDYCDEPSTYRIGPAEEGGAHDRH